MPETSSMPLGDEPNSSESEPIPRYGYSGQRGLGGSMVSPEMSGSESYGPPPAAHSQSHQMSPDEMLAMADRMEKDFLHRTDGSSQVDPRLIGMTDGPDLDPALKRQLGQGVEAPDWLQQYMSSQPYTDPYHQVMPGRLDIINSNKYLSEKERLKMLRDEQRTAGLR